MSVKRSFDTHLIPGLDAVFCRIAIDKRSHEIDL